MRDFGVRAAHRAITRRHNDSDPEYNTGFAPARRAERKKRGEREGGMQGMHDDDGGGGGGPALVEGDAEKSRSLIQLIKDTV